MGRAFSATRAGRSEAKRPQSVARVVEAGGGTLGCREQSRMEALEQAEGEGPAIPRWGCKRHKRVLKEGT